MATPQPIRAGSVALGVRTHDQYGREGREVLSIVPEPNPKGFSPYVAFMRRQKSN
jgi:hypothetical protein